jgi:PAS domain S-box-containing protein
MEEIVDDPVCSSSHTNSVQTGPINRSDSLCIPMKSRSLSEEQNHEQGPERMTGTTAHESDNGESVRLDGGNGQDELLSQVLAEGSCDWDYWVDPQGVLRYVSQACERITGYSSSEFLRDSSLVHRLIHQEDLATVMEHGCGASASNDPLDQGSLDFRIVRRDGEIRWINHVCQPVHGRSGEFLGRRVSNRDITERKLSEVDVREKEQLYREVMECQQHGICRFLPHGTLTFVNSALGRLFKMTAEDLVGRNYLDLIDDSQHKDVEQQLALLDRDNPTCTFEQKITASNSQPQWYLWTMHGAFDAAGRVVEIKAVAREITDRKQVENALRQSQARYGKLISAIPDGVVVYDTEGKVTYVNETFVQMFGWSLEELLGKSIDFVPAQEKQRTREAWQETFDGKRVLFETKRKTKAGKLLAIQLRTALLRDPEGNVTHSIVIHRDISESRRIREALEHAYDELEKRVEKRTEDLAKTNDRLLREITERKRADERRRESEERFRAVFETAKDCIFVKDDNFVYTHVNQAFLKALDLQDEQVVGKTDNDIFGLSQATYIRDLERRVLDGQVMEATYSLTTRRFSKTFHCIRVPLRKASGETAGVCGIARDVTEQKALERVDQRPVGQFRSVVMEVTLEHLRLAASSESIVLLLGESGSGKDYLSKFIHDHSSRAGGPYFAINCAALAASVAESELFGHEPGSFTGSRGRKRGLLEMAEGGTLLLNEIGELSQELQAKLLTFLDTQSFTRVGGEKTVSINARIIAATNRNLEHEVAAGRFRQDLYYRLNVLAIRVPSLRERKEDIPVLAINILEGLSKKLGRLVPPVLDASALECLSQYDWPGNVRELGNVLERALILSRSDMIAADDIALPKNKIDESLHEKEIPVSVSVSDECSLNEALETAKRLMIVSALRRCKGNVSAAARLLGISRDALRYHKKALEI